MSLNDHVPSLPLEEWKDVKGFYGMYSISNYGKIYSVKRRKILKPYKTSNRLRYRSIVLWSGDKRHRYAIHRLVASHFIRPPKLREQINHKDGDPSNNVVTNLEWVNSSQNVLHAYANGLRSSVGEKNNRHKLTKREVSFIRYLRGLYPQIKTQDIAKFYDVSLQSIHNVLIFARWKNN